MHFALQFGQEMNVLYIKCALEYENLQIMLYLCSRNDLTTEFQDEQMMTSWQIYESCRARHHVTKIGLTYY